MAAVSNERLYLQNKLKHAEFSDRSLADIFPTIHVSRKLHLVSLHVSIGNDLQSDTGRLILRHAYRWAVYWSNLHCKPV